MKTCKMKGDCNRINLLLLVLLGSSLSAGLELNLDLNVSTQSGMRSACAVLKCMEEIELVSSGNTTRNHSSRPTKTIARLTVFKIDSSGLHRNTSNAGIEIASLSPQRPRITMVSNATKVYGVLEDQRAVLSLEILKSNDCMADFLCQLITVDAHGNQSLTSARVNQGKRRENKENQGIESQVSLQILELVHQLDTKLAVENLHTEMLSAHLKALEKKLAGFDENMKTLDSRMLNFENNVNAKLDSLGESMQQLEAKVCRIENRMEDKIDSSERSLRGDLTMLQNRLEDKLQDNIEEKLDSVDHKMTAFIDEAQAYSQHLGKSVNESFTALVQDLEVEQKRVLSQLQSASDKLMDDQMIATDALVTAVRNLTETQTALSGEVLENLSQVDDKITESGDKISEKLSQDFTSLGQSLRQSFQDFTSTVNQSTTEILSSANNLFLQTNETAKAAFESLLYPKRCSKGVLSVLSSPLYPYPLIQPNKYSDVNIPHLCDTATDGGGWIIIQRRTTGDVDFSSRGWEEYKAGFGSFSGDFWLGNEDVHRITSSGPYELRVDLVFQGKPSYARYGKFSIGDEAHSYKLDVGEYSGTAGDSLINQSHGQNFTTIDRDNNKSNTRNCAERCMGAWWFTNCGYSSLNGKWQEGNYRGPFWFSLTSSEPVTYSEMKIRHLFAP